MPDERVREAYAARAAEYIDLFDSIDATSELDRKLVLAWAQVIDGYIIDVGCGPGHWTDFLREHGADIEGVDPVPEFVAEAQQQHTSVAFRIGHAGQLGVGDASLGGILAWYSLIHTAPDDIDAPLIEFARCIRPGGSLALGFFEGAELVPFDHAVTTAYFWPVDQLAARLDHAGFQVVDVHTRTDPGSRAHGAIIAQRGA